MQFYSYTFLLLFSLFSNLVNGQSNKIEHSSWDSLLKTHVDHNGNVDYKGFLKDTTTLSNYINKLESKPINNTANKNEKLAYYINLYNAATVKLILDNYPTNSIKNISKPWDKQWIKVGNKTLSLGDIEHKILRKMNEPRIHFAINCASFSCPMLKNEAFIASKIETQLEQATKDFINDSKRNKISSSEVELSQIFKWFKKDFTTKGTIVDFIKPYTTINFSKKTSVKYLDYNWSLNEK
ncbi:uncharacterized protein DUF547 [Maribacter vaceletii]|uniref:Uncharacterized protein DUF547 n=1 Tax=Maribacter vaceletii TaxID=1206816 RepID=A0A495EF27_9FLAO|nr:DUF547 domain-containing protein [Maribacter vaceletii]RKR15261.1 uncharacterized protein DUF547 [Maribacter vaceletii]